MRQARLCAAFLLLTPFLCAQRRFASPPGADFEEGNSSSGVMWGSTINYKCRVQQIDANFIGHPMAMVVRRLAWRRDKAAASTGVARQAEITVVMAHADYNAIGTTFANNYKDTPVTVFAKKYINLPDWTQVPNPAPAPFDLVVLFDVPWVYNRVDSILWDVVVTDTTATGRYSDDWFSSQATQNYGQTHLDIGPGCTTANGVFTKRDVYSAISAGLSARFQITGAPSGTPCLLLLGVRTASVPVPGLCAPLGVDFIASLATGVSDASGAVSHPLTAPWNSAFSWAPLATQALALDPAQPGLPVALSNATLGTLPRSDQPPGINVRRTYVMNSATTGTGSSPSVSAVPTEYSF